MQLNKRYLFLGGLAAAVLLLSLIPSILFYREYQKTKQLLYNPILAAKEEVKTYKEKVARLMIIPTGEDPVIITVTDMTKLKDQPFFANAKIGDKVLLFNNARKAVIYDPAANKIVEVGPLSIPSPTPGIPGEETGNFNLGQLSPAPSPKLLSVAIYNGTAISGIANNAETNLKEKIPGISVVVKEYAKVKNYDKTYIVDLSGIRKREADNIAAIIGGTVSDSLPEGETAPEDARGKGAEILIILGKNFIPSPTPTVKVPIK